MRRYYRNYTPLITVMVGVIVATRLVSLDLTSLIPSVGPYASSDSFFLDHDLCNVVHKSFYRVQNRPTFTKNTTKPIILAASTQKYKVMSIQRIVEVWSHYVFDHQMVSSETQHMSEADNLGIENKQNPQLNLMSHTTYPYDEHGARYITPDKLQDFDQIILLVSNPLSTIFQESHTGALSYSLWGGDSKKKTDDEFQAKFEMWKQHIEYWMELQLHDYPFIISYEDFVGSNSGTVITTSLLQYIRKYIRVEENAVTQSIDVGCIWRQVFRYSSYSYDDDYSYVTVDQFKQMLNGLIELKSQYKFIPELFTILNTYIQHTEQIMWNQYGEEL